MIPMFNPETVNKAVIVLFEVAEEYHESSYFSARAMADVLTRASEMPIRHLRRVIMSKALFVADRPHPPSGEPPCHGGQFGEGVSPFS